jgi:lysophospholipase L1-like esterase
MPMRKLYFGSSAVIVTVLMLANACPAVAGPVQTYLALGDSIAFGETNVIPVSFGDQGYVKPFADFLATQNGGVRPDVINLAFPGETSSSFFTGIPIPGDAPHTVLDSFNLNYQANPAQSQNSLMLSTIAAEQAAGHVISHVSFSLGRNDLGAFIAQHQDFFSLTSLEQQSLINGFFGDLMANYVAVLTELRGALPQAQILLLNSYNEQAVFGASDPFDIANEIFDAGQTEMIASLTGPFDARLVDIHDPFIGHEAAYTFVLSGGVHPNDTGYGVIADQMIDASIPEPPSFVILASAVVLIALSQRAMQELDNRLRFTPIRIEQLIEGTLLTTQLNATSDARLCPLFAQRIPAARSAVRCLSTADRSYRLIDSERSG